MSASRELRIEILNLQRRRDELQTRDRATAVAALEKAQQEVVDDVPKALDRATSAQARLLAVDGAVSALETRINELEAEFQQTAATENVAAATDHILRLDPEAKAAADRFETLRKERKRMVARLDAQINAERSQIIRLQNEFFEQLETLAPGFQRLTFQAAPELQEQIQNTLDELKQRGFSGEVLCFTDWTGRSIHYPGVTSFNSYKLLSDAELPIEVNDEQTTNKQEVGQ